MRIRAWGLLSMAVCALLLGLAPAAKARDSSVTSFDGTKIVLSFFPAEGLADGAKAPTVLIGHGFAQSRDTDPNSEGREDLFGLVGPGPFRRAGFNVLTWDARGFGQSGGTVQADSPDFEARDVQALLDFTAQQPEAQLDGPGDPRVGMSGASYGGGIQFVTAAIDRRVDVIAPDIAWHSLLTALFKDHAVKSGWGTVLFGGGTASGLSQGLVGGETGALDPHIQSAYTQGLATGDISDDDRAWFDARGPHQLLDRIRIPTFLVQGTADTLFSLQESIDNYAALEKNGIPLKMMWFCGGHGVCLTGGGSEPKRLENAVIAWFNRYLKRDAAIDTGPKFEWLADDAKWRSAGGYPLPPKAALTGDGSGTLPIAQTSDSGQAQIAASPAANAVNVAIASPTADTQILGPPKLELTYSGTAAPAPSTHVYAQIVNLKTGQVVGNQATPIPVTLDGAEHTISRPLEPLAAAATAGSGYQLQIAASTAVYGPQRAAGAVTFSRIHVELPTVDDKAAAAGAGGPGAADRAVRIKLGSLWRTAHSRRKVRVTVAGRNPLSRVVVRISTTRGKLLGRSKPVTVRGRRKVTMILRRGVRSGRYRLVASGRTTAGDTVSAQRTERLH
jgi:ABC-2 type transport system ATP-binding protein